MRAGPAGFWTAICALAPLLFLLPVGGYYTRALMASGLAIAVGAALTRAPTSAVAQLGQALPAVWAVATLGWIAQL